MGIIARLAIALALLAASRAYANITNTTASVRPDNSLLVDVEVMTSGNAARLAVTYQAEGVEPLVSRWAPVDRDGITKITVGRLRADKIYSYSVRAIDNDGAPAGTAQGTFRTGPLPAALSMNTYKLQGRSTAPLVVMPHLQANFRGYVALDLRSPDAPQIVWYYANAPSTASGMLQVDTVNSILQER